MTVDDIAKVSILLQNGGRHEGKQILSPTKLAEVLYQTDKCGLPTGESNEFGDHSYHMSLWHTPHASESGFATSVAEMHGWGVLVIDDDPEMRRLLAQMLQLEGFQFEVAAGGQEGLRRARELRPRVITLDVLMPDLAGWTVLSQLKADANLASVPVVMITAWPETERAFALGVADYLSKPVDSGRLMATLRKYYLPPPGDHALVVEDDPDMRSVLRQVLETEHWVATTAENGKDALKQFTRDAQAPSLIILDLMMPVMDGFQFIAELQKNEVWRKIPVVVVNAKDLTTEDHERLRGQGAEILKKEAFGRKNFCRPFVKPFDNCSRAGWASLPAPRLNPVRLSQYGKQNYEQDSLYR